MAKFQKQSRNNASAANEPKALSSIRNVDTAPNYTYWLLGVLLITIISFWPSLDNAFVNWDDDVNIIENRNTESLDAEHIKAIFTDRVIGNYNPLPILTLAIERSMVGLEPKLYHVDNLLLHLVATLSVFWILVQLGLRPFGAAVGALLFGIHPMRVESVAWVTERKDVLLAAFYFPAIYYYIRSIKMPEKRTKYITITLIFFVLALFSKIQAVALPLTMLVIDYLLGRELKWNLIFEKAIFFGLSLAFGLIGIYFLKDNGSLQDVATYTFADRLLIGMYTLCIYIMKFFIPYEMSPLYPYPSSLDAKFFVAPLGVLAFFAAAYWLWKNDKRVWLFGVAFFFVNVVFLLQVLGAGQAFLADRFTYVAYFGLFFIVAYYSENIDEKYSNILNTVLAVVFLVSMFVTRRQCDVWQDGGTLWTHVLKYYPESDLPWSNRARFYRESKNDYKSALEGYTDALKVKEKPELYNSRGKTYFDLSGNEIVLKTLKLTQVESTRKAIDDYNKAMSLDTTQLEIKTRSEFHANRGAAYGRYAQETGDKSHLATSSLDLEAAIKLDPKNDNSYLNGFLVYSELGDFNRAMFCVDEYNKLKPGESDMYYERATLSRKMGQEDQAILDLQIAIKQANAELKLNDAKRRNRGTLILGAAYNELGRIYFRKGDRPQAKVAMENAIRYEFKVDMEVYNAVK